MAVALMKKVRLCVAGCVLMAPDVDQGRIVRGKGNVVYSNIRSRHLEDVPCSRSWRRRCSQKRAESNTVEDNFCAAYILTHRASRSINDVPGELIAKH